MSRDIPDNDIRDSNIQDYDELWEYNWSLIEKKI